MNMSGKFDSFQGDAVIKRGYAVYEEWNKNNISSRKIVKSVERAVSSENAVEALALIFALDLRVKERYKGIVKRLLGYFSLRRERNALKRLKDKLNISDSADIRDAIEIELKNIRERLGENDPDDENNENHGGKQAEMSGKELKKANEKSSPEQKEDRAEAPVEHGEKKTEEKIENGGQIELDVNKQSGEKKGFDSRAQFDGSKAESRFDREKASPTGETKFRNENNGAEIISETKENITNESKSYNDAVDYIPPLDKAESEKEEKLSFIDEVIIDNMIKGESDIIGHNPLADVRREPAENISRESIIINTEHNGDKDKDAHLYDKAVLEKNGVLQLNMTEGEETRFSIQVDTETPSAETIIRRGITDSFSEKEILARKEFQEAEFRRQFSIDTQETVTKGLDFEKVRGNSSDLSNVKSINERK